MGKLDKPDYQLLATLCHALFISSSLFHLCINKTYLINVTFVQAILLVPGERGVQKINVHVLIGFKF